MYHEKTCTFTLGILCDSWNLRGWHLWISSDANWIPRCWDMTRIKVNKKEGHLSTNPGQKHVKFRRFWMVTWLVGTDIQVLEATSVSEPACSWIKKGATLFIAKFSPRRNLHRDWDWASSGNVQGSHSQFFTSNNELFSSTSQSLL